MKPQTIFFKWLAAAVALAMFLNIALAISPAQAQSPLPSVVNQTVSSGQRGGTPFVSENPPVMFIENVGQFNSEVRFQISSTNATIFLTQEAIWVTFLKPLRQDSKKELDTSDPLNWKLANLPHERVNLKILFPGANPQAKLEPFDKLETQISNLIGDDPSDWKTNVPVWKGVRYVNIYPGADLIISSQNGRLDWYFDVRDTGKFFAREGHIFKQGLQIKLAGQKGLRLSSEGSLLVETELGNFPLPSFRMNGLANSKLRQNSPCLETDGLWLIEPGNSSSVKCQSSFSPVSFRSSGTWNTSSSAFLGNQDPQVSMLQSGAQDRLLYATLLGGSGWETGEGIAIDEAGYIYVAGYTDSPDFPAYAGYDQSYAGTGDVFITKLDPNTGQIIYATFLGGNLVEFSASSIAVDQSGAAYVTGCTESSDFPIQNAYDPSFNGPVHSAGIHTCSDAFIAKLNPAGNDLEYSTFIGGNGNDSIESSVIDSSGNIYFIGYTESSELYGVPIGNKYFTGKINVDGSELVYIKSLANRSNSIAVGSDGFTYIVGTSGTVWASYNVTVISLDQNGGINYSTTFGGNNADRGWGVAVDSYGSVAITGDTASATDFPTTTEALRTQTHGQDAFVTRLYSSGTIAYSTLLGGDVSDSGTSIAIDSQGVLYVVGSTMGINFINPDDSIKPDPGGWDFDVFAVTLVPVSAAKYAMGYGTYVGGTGWDFSYATVGTVDENGNVYITGETDSPDFVGTSGTSDYDYQAFVVKVATGGTAYDCLGTTDIFEPDDTPSTSSPIIIGEIQRHTLCPQNDEDWVNFDTSTIDYFNRNVLVETFDLEPDSIHPNGDTQLTVLDESAINQIGTNQFRGFGPFPGSTDTLQSSRVVWHPATDGVFNIKVFPEKQINEQEGSGYSLRLANPLTMIDPVDQGSWVPTSVNVPYVSRFGNVIYFTQFFTYEQAELDALNNLNTTLAWEFRRPGVDTNTGREIKDSNVDYGDYWQNVNGGCVGHYWTNLPNPTDKYSEEVNSIPGCPEEVAFRDEEFELYVSDPSQLIAGKPYFVMIEFHIHNEYLNSVYQFYISKVEHCKKDPFTLCNVIPGHKKSANLIEGYLQPAP